VIKKYLAVVVAFVFIGSGMAHAHQPVVLLNTDTTAAKGPLLEDGTVSFAIRASFTKVGEKKAFRAQFKAGDALAIQYLIIDKKPESSLRTTSLPSLVVTSPMGTSFTMKLNERTKFYEPYGKVNYLYLARYKAVAQAGVYSFVITSKGKAGITVAVGEREVRGEVSRGATPTQSASATPTPTPSASSTPAPSASATPIASSTPSASPTPSQSAFVPGFTLAEVKKNNNAANCWAIVDDNVYNLTAWINGHPGGANAILNLCGTDATLAFKAQHENKTRPEGTLGSYKIGPLKE
jgi:hypothetical protein